MTTDPRRFLRRDQREELPLARQLLVYLDPFALFLDASRGTPAARERALAYNRAMRGMLTVYLRRWLFIAGVLFLGTQAATLVVPAAALGAGFCIAFVVACVTAAVYILLGSSGTHNHRP